jgi:hypothetical protein
MAPDIPKTLKFPKLSSVLPETRRDSTEEFEFNDELEIYSNPRESIFSSGSVVYDAEVCY